MMMELEQLYFEPLFEGEPPADPVNPPVDPAEPPADKDTYTKDELEKIIQDRVGKSNNAYKKLEVEFETLSKKSQMTAKERQDLESRYEQIQKEAMTKEELARKEKEKSDRKYKNDLEELTKEKETWQARFTDSTIQRDITDAAVANKAYNPSQIVAIVRQKSKLIEELNSNNEPTGRLVTRIAISDTDDKGKAVELELSPKDAIKRMKEMEDYSNLFQYEGNGGFGGNNRGRGTTGSAASKAKSDPRGYVKARMKGELNLDEN